MIKKIKALSLVYFEEALQNRRHIHQHPELSFKETNTASFIFDAIEKMGVSCKKNIGGNGILATLKGKKPEQKIIALRADFDALPILEETNLDFSSENKGVMHACGHDIHSSSLLGTLKVLNDLKKEWEGTIHFVFQHAEELLPGGAIQMLDADLFSDLQPEYIIAQHVEPDLPVGVFGFKSGSYMASSDEIYLTIKGRGGHAALPHKTNNTVLAAAQILVNLQKIALEIVPSSIPMVLSFGRMVAEGATNIIPDKVEVSGTFRMFDENLRKKVHQQIIEISESTAKVFGTTCVVEIRKGYPVLKNDVKLVSQARQVAKDTFGTKSIVDLDYRLTSEDFGYFSQRYSSLFYRLGVGYTDKSLNFPLHSSKFNPNEEALKYSIEFMSNLAVKLLKE